MAKQVFEPWFAVKVGARKNSKILALPNDTARLGWFLGVLAEAKLQRPGGRFVSRDQLLESIPGRFAEHVDDYIREGLLHQAPRLCPDCRREVGSVPPGTLVVHDWRKHQRDPDAPIRAANWRDAHQANGVDNQPENDEETPDERSANAPRTPEERTENAGSTRGVTADSRVHGHEPARGLARQETGTKTVTESGSSDVEYPAPDAREPTFSKAQLLEWATFGPEWDRFKAAWLSRGFRHPPSGAPDDPAGQRGLLYPILDARPTTLPQWVREAKGKTAHDVIGHVIERWHDVQADAGLEDETGPTAEQDPTSTPESARAILGRLTEGLAQRAAS